MATAAPGRLAAWMRHHLPTREGIERNRLLRPVAHRVLAPSLWRFGRRSVPRGVGLGVFCGVLFPFAHMPSAAVLSIPVRANLPIAVGVTIPSTVLIPAYWWAAYRIGHWILSIDRTVPGRPLITDVHQHEGWLHWLVSDRGPSVIVGLMVLAVLLAGAAYALATVVWRWRIARKWRRRHTVARNGGSVAALPQA